MFLQGEFPNGEEELVAPTSVVAGGDVEDDGDQTPDILHRHGLCVEVDDGGGLVQQQGLVQIRRAAVGGVVLLGVVFVVT